MTLYQGRTYSCGCVKRPRKNGVDFTGVTVVNSEGNRRHGRKLEVLKHETEGWYYFCYCCNTAFVVHEGLNSNLLQNLKSMAGEVCPNFRPFTSLQNIGLLAWSVGLTKWTGGYPGMAERLAKFYKPEHVKLENGMIAGFFGDPNEALGRAAGVMPDDPERFAQKRDRDEPETTFMKTVYKVQKPSDQPGQNLTEETVMPEDPDGFGDLM
jgi:hypothetical protein